MSSLHRRATLSSPCDSGFSVCASKASTGSNDCYYLLCVRKIWPSVFIFLLNNTEVCGGHPEVPSPINTRKSVVNLNELMTFLGIKFPLHPQTLFNLFKLGSDPGSHGAFNCLFILSSQKFCIPHPPCPHIDDFLKSTASCFVECSTFWIGLMVSLRCHSAGSLIRPFPVHRKSGLYWILARRRRS